MPASAAADRYGPEGWSTLTTSQRLFDFRFAFDHPVTVWLLWTVLGLLLAGGFAGLILKCTRGKSDPLAREVLVRTASWAVIVVLVSVPILLGAFWAILMVAALSILAYVEYSRVTGLFRERALSWAVIALIVLIGFAVLDHWYDFFTAIAPLGFLVLLAVSLGKGDPRGFVQNVAIASLGFLLFGVCLGHLAYFANSTAFRPLMLLLLVAVSLNDVYAFICGKTFGKRKLCPKISPGKTIAGAVGAVVLTTLTVAGFGQYLLPDTAAMQWYHLIACGILLSVCGQVGDLMLSAIKRDVGIKDTGSLIPGHGGLLDRCDSLLLAAPAMFHFIGYFNGIGLDQATCIITSPN